MKLPKTGRRRGKVGWEWKRGRDVEGDGRSY